MATKPSFRVFLTKHHGPGLWSAVMLRRHRIAFDTPPPAAMAADPETALRRLAPQAALLSDEEATATALAIWERTNLANLEDNILPTRPRATLILKKGADHVVETVALRRPFR